MNIQTDRSHHQPPSSTHDGRENRWANDTDGFALAAQPGKSQGRPMKSPGSKPIVAKNGLPIMRSPREPLSRSLDANPRPDDSNSRAQFHAPTKSTEQARWPGHLVASCRRCGELRTGRDRRHTAPLGAGAESGTTCPARSRSRSSRDRPRAGRVGCGTRYRGLEYNCDQPSLPLTTRPCWTQWAPCIQGHPTTTVCWSGQSSEMLASKETSLEPTVRAKTPPPWTVWAVHSTTCGV